MGKGPTAGVILAAGMSRRLGRPKQLLPLQNKCLLQWVVEAALGSKLERVVLVLGHRAQAIAAAMEDHLRHPRLDIVNNEHYMEGMGQSLRAGLLEVKDRFPSAMFLLGDQPLMDSGTIDLLLERFWDSGKEICVPVHEGMRRNPTIFGQRYYEQLLAIEGDQGARHLIEANPENVLYVEIRNSSLFVDVDTEENLKELAALMDKT